MLRRVLEVFALSCGHCSCYRYGFYCDVVGVVLAVVVIAIRVVVVIVAVVAVVVWF